MPDDADDHLERAAVEAFASFATLVLAPEEATVVLDELDVLGLAYDFSGATRNLGDVVQTISVVAPSFAGLAFIVEKLRRLRLPRTYVHVTAEAVHVWTDSHTPDGRVLVIGADGSVSNLADDEVSTATLIDHFARASSLGPPSTPSPDPRTGPAT